MRKNTFANGKQKEQENLLFSYKVSHENIFLKNTFLLFSTNRIRKTKTLSLLYLNLKTYFKIESVMR